MKIAKLNIEGYIGELDSAFAGEKSFTLNNLKEFLNNLDSEIYFSQSVYFNAEDF